MARHVSSTMALDEAERSWWSEHGDIEERYCWVQTPAEQRIVRGRYLRSIADEVEPGSRVLEIGCGTGWLCLLLAEQGLRDVVGTDFSSDQLARARASARERGLESRVTFVLEAELDQVGGDFDVVIMHAFLHHLSTDEITRVLDRVADRLRPNGVLLAMEPVHHAEGPTRSPVELALLRRLERLPGALARRRLRRQSRDELEVRTAMAGRPQGEPPFGPSPKEIPFEPGELTALLESRFQVRRSEPALCYTHLVAQEILLSALSQPRTCALAKPLLLRAASALDRRLLMRTPAPSTVWVFELTVCRRSA